MSAVYLIMSWLIDGSWAYTYRTESKVATCATDASDIADLTDLQDFELSLQVVEEPFPKWSGHHGSRHNKMPRD